MPAKNPKTIKVKGTGGAVFDVDPDADFVKAGLANRSLTEVTGTAKAADKTAAKTGDKTGDADSGKTVDNTGK